MPGEIFRIRGGEAAARPGRPRSPEESEREARLIRRILDLPVIALEAPRKTDSPLLHLASALLDCEVGLDEILGCDCCGASAQRLILFVYVGEGLRGGVSIEALCSSQALAPAAVSLRWAAKLFDDGILELSQDPSNPEERLIRLSPNALGKFEEWLQRAKSKLCSEKPAVFAV